MPGFGPAAEILLFRQKDPKPLPPRPASSNYADANHGRASQLAPLRQGSPVHKSIHPWGRAAGVGQQGGGYAGKKTIEIILNKYKGLFCPCILEYL